MTKLRLSVSARNNVASHRGPCIGVQVTVLLNELAIKTGRYSRYSYREAKSCILEYHVMPHLEFAWRIADELKMARNQVHIVLNKTARRVLCET